MFDVRRFLAHSLQFFVICSVHSIQNVEPLAVEKVNCRKNAPSGKSYFRLMKTNIIVLVANSTNRTLKTNQEIVA